MNAEERLVVGFIARVSNASKHERVPIPPLRAFSPQQSIVELLFRDIMLFSRLLDVLLDGLIDWLLDSHSGVL